MEGGNRSKAAVLTALLGCALALLSACSGGVAQADYDAAKQQLAAKEQEVATAKQQVASLQEQLKPAAAREPKRLEAKVAIEMDEATGAMHFGTLGGAQGGPFRLPSGKTVGMRFVNNGEKLHEFMIGRTIKTVDGKLDGYEVNLLENIAADVFVYANGKMVEIGGASLEEIEVEPGAEVWMRMKFPAEMKGEWEIGCFVQEPNEKGHYDQGMRAKLIIE